MNLEKEIETNEILTVLKIVEGYQNNREAGGICWHFIGLYY